MFTGTKIVKIYKACISCWKVFNYEQAQNVDSFTESESVLFHNSRESESVLSHYPGDGESCPQKNIGENKINKAEEIENATEEMDLALVDKNSKAWEDLIVKRVARQMQMK